MSARPLDPRHRAALLSALERAGRGPSGRPLPGSAGSLLLKPATDPRYEPDLLQMQRQMRAQAASERQSLPLMVRAAPAPEQVERVYKSTTLPKMLAPRNEARDAELERARVEAPAYAGGDSSFLPKVKSLPLCAQDFLRGRIAADPADIRLHDRGGGIPNWFDNHVTYGNDIYLAEGGFQRRDERSMRDKFHEIGHVDQNARMNLNSFDHFVAYLPFLGHDASPLEEDARSKFERKMYDRYVAEGLDKRCRF